VDGVSASARATWISCSWVAIMPCMLQACWLLLADVVLGPILRARHQRLRRPSF